MNYVHKKSSIPVGVYFSGFANRFANKDNTHSYCAKQSTVPFGKTYTYRCKALPYPINFVDGDPKGNGADPLPPLGCKAYRAYPLTP